MEYTIKQLADLAGISRRTLHHYDQIGLLKPARKPLNQYRVYDESAVLQLQQILFYRELGFKLAEIKQIMAQPDFDILQALQSHRVALEKRAERILRLIDTVDHTIEHLNGAIQMTENQIFEAFSEEQQAEYAAEARQRWDPKLVDSSMKLWKSYSPEKKQQVLEEGQAIYLDIKAQLEAGAAPDSPAVQACLKRWHQHMRYFYEPSWEILRGLGQHYAADPRFRANFEKIHPELPEYLNQAIQVYTAGKV